MKKKSGKEARIPALKKEIKDFLLSEEGKITKKDIAKIGLSLAILGLMLPSEAAAHNNFFFDSDRGGHYSHSSHNSHGSHYSW